MKIRNGFVSNSSSSSFVVIAPKEDVDIVLKSMKEYEQAVINFVKTETNFLNTKINIFSGMTGNYDSWEYGFDFDVEEWTEKEGLDPDDFNTYDVWEKFQEALEKQTKNIIVQEQEM